MSTRSTTWFVYGENYGENKKPTAIIYRHPDGYPEGAGVDILRFLEECSKLPDPRFSDPSYLAAKYVVFLADMFNYTYTGHGEHKRPESRLQFISVGVVNQDPGDIEYRYVVNCGNLINRRPVVKCFELSGTWDSVKNKDIPQSKWILTEVPIPPIPKAEEKGA